jgi:hypothetical protein
MHWNYEDFTRAFFELTKIDLSCYKERQMKRRYDRQEKHEPVAGKKLSH